MVQLSFIKEIKDEITNPYDGPVTRFVAICRAMKIAESGNFDYSEVAEVLDDLLDEYNFADDESSGINTAGP